MQIYIRKQWLEKIPYELSTIFRRLKKYEIYIVGGAVRDWFIGRTPKDFDVEVFASSYDELVLDMKKIGLRPLVDDKKFGVVRVRLDALDEPVEFSLPRFDNKVGEKHNDFHVVYEGQEAPKTVETASRRRDFTCNALYYDVHTGNVIDVHNGVEDLREKILRVVDPATFTEDPLRVWRILPAMSKNKLTSMPFPYSNWIEKMRELDDNVVPCSRYGELRKAFDNKTTSDSWFSTMMNAYMITGELAFLRSVERKGPYPESDADTQFVIWMTYVVRRLEKFSGYEQDFLDYLGVPKKLSRRILALFSAPEITESNMVFVANQLHPIETVYHAIFADGNGAGEGVSLSYTAKKLGCLHGRIPPLVTGKHLLESGVEEGPELGVMLYKAYMVQLREGFTKVEDVLEFLVL